MGEAYRLRFKVRVVMGDVDADRIHFAALFRYMDRAFGELSAALGHPHSAVLGSGYAMPVVHCECTYRRPVGLDDELLVESYIGRVGNSSFTVCHEFYRLPDGENVASGRVTHVFLDRKTGRPIPAPDWIRQAAGRRLRVDA